MPNQVGTRSTSGPVLISDAEGNEKVGNHCTLPFKDVAQPPESLIIRSTLYPYDLELQYLAYNGDWGMS